METDTIFVLIPEDEFRIFLATLATLQIDLVHAKEENLTLKAKIAKKEATSNKKRKNLNSVLGVIKQERGELSENRIVSAIADIRANELFGQVYSCRKATKEEDRAGIDIIVETILGQILIQAKSSKKNAEAFKTIKKANGLTSEDFPLIIVASVDMELAAIRRSVLGHLRHGLEILQRRSKGLDILDLTDEIDF